MMHDSQILISAQRELIGAIAEYHRHDNCYPDECHMAREPHTPCDPGFLLARHVQTVIDFLGEMRDMNAEGRAQAA